MQRTWILSNWVTSILLASVLFLFLVTEVMVVFISHRLLESLFSLEMLLNLVLISIPGIAGVWGYNATRRQRSVFEAAGQTAAFVWLSRQFLTATIFAYAAIVSVLIFLANGVQLGK